ncbi:MAG: hypothetical protein CR987_00265 [Draconibacterium sp.]|nr:MAG: hypothetical protein CR987_00265 [Draconibacterium sp.]
MKLVYFWKPFLWFSLVCYVLFSPTSNAPSKLLKYLPASLLSLMKQYPYILDKMVHFSLFFVLCLLFFRPFKIIHKKYILLASIVSVVLAVLMETFQNTISASRHYDIKDLYANVFGVLAATIFYLVLIKNSKWERYF